MGWLLGGRGVNAALSLVYLALATHSLGLLEFGQFSVIVGLGQMIAGLATFQTWQLIVSRSARNWDAGDTLGFALALDAISVLVGTAASAIAVTIASRWLPIPANLLLPTFVFCLVSLISIRSTPTGILRLHDRYGRAAIAESVTPIIRAIGAGIAVLVMPTISGFLIVWALAELASAAVHWAFAIREERPRWRAIGLKRLSRSGSSPWAFVWATNFSGSLAVASKQALMLMVAGIGGAPLAGGFRVASQLGFALLKLAQAVSRAIYPEFVRDGQAAPELAGRMTMFSILAGAVSVLLAALFGEWVIALIAGPDFAFAHWAMVILVAAAGVDLASASPEALLVAQGRAGAAFFLRAIPTAGALALLPLAISEAGLIGATSCVLLASLIAFASFLRMMKRSQSGDFAAYH